MPSKALLAVSGRMRELQNEHHMKAFGLQVIIKLMFTPTGSHYFPLDVLCVKFEANEELV